MGEKLVNSVSCVTTDHLNHDIMVTHILALPLSDSSSLVRYVKKKKSKRECLVLLIRPTTSNWAPSTTYIRSIFLLLIQILDVLHTPLHQASRLSQFVSLHFVLFSSLSSPEGAPNSMISVVRKSAVWFRFATEWQLQKKWGKRWKSEDKVNGNTTAIKEKCNFMMGTIQACSKW